MLTSPVAVWYDNGRFDYVGSLSDLAQKIHKMVITEAELSDQSYRLKNRITLIYREASLGVDPIFELDRMCVDNHSSTPQAYLRMSNDGQWELRDGYNNLVDLKAIDNARELKNYFTDEASFKKEFSNVL
ncbi:MAG: hypothetical protein ACRYFK_20485 [Janthinobacterium lividum]